MNIPYDHRTSLSTTSHFQCYHLRAFPFIMHDVCCSIRRAVSNKKFFQEKRMFNVFIGIACRFFDKCYRSFLSPYSQLQTYSFWHPICRPMITHETATVTNAQHGLTETRDVLDGSQMVALKVTCRRQRCAMVIRNIHFLLCVSVFNFMSKRVRNRVQTPHFEW